MKRLFSLIIIAFMLSITCSIVNAQTDHLVSADQDISHVQRYDEVPSVSGRPSVYDAAHLLSDEQFEELTEKLDELRSKHNMDIIVVTTDSMNGMSRVDYADDFYDYNGYRNDGILLLVSMENREWYFSTKGKGIDYFTDYGLEKISDKVVGRLSVGQYYEAFNVFADQADYYIEQGKAGNIIDVNNKPKSFGIFNGVISAVVGGLSSLFTSLILKGQMKSIKMERYAGSYVVDRSFVLTGSSDMLVDRKVHRSYNPPSRDSGSGHSSGGGSSVHRSSSGATHGGRGGHF